MVYTLKDFIKSLTCLLGKENLVEIDSDLHFGKCRRGMNKINILIRMHVNFFVKLKL